ncbi:hypothetical protein [Draconibacterium mangrovi]|uniref:hypothetical protein n=1 Tax=Draconibacterium mangrovi TaxID=2697469 RepID=UPI0013D6C7AD|nr:hypothetical protein [Draconibacterium mangrovi]
MARKKNNRKKKPAQQANGGYKKFIRELYDTLRLAGIDQMWDENTDADKHLMYSMRIRIQNPVACNELVSSAELKRIAMQTKRYYREPTVERKKDKFSAYQLMLLYCYLAVREQVIARNLGNKNDPVVLERREHKNKMLDQFGINCILGHFRIMIQLGSPDYKYFGLALRHAAIYKENPSMEMVPDIYGIPAEKKIICLDGHKRPAYRLGKPDGMEIFTWSVTAANILGDAYTGDKEKLDIYIQSHALKRMAQRLDLLKRPAINYALWENTITITSFVHHRGKLLLPVKIYDIKIGYLVAEVVDDVLLFKTFLFITHNFTPEGDTLRRITGLGKEDISYWKIDRLSTFVNLDTGKYRALTELFEQAGLADIFQLKDKDFDVEQMQEANLDGLMRYIQRGKNADTIQKQEFEALLQNA